jgi:phage pi2 protein 07
MGRTLVLPPEQRMYLLAKGRGKQKTDFSFADFFPMRELAEENDGLHMITMQEFLETEAMTGNLRDKNTGEVTFPPENRTDWNGQEVKSLKEWLRNATHTPLWSPSSCMAAFPASGDHKDSEALKQMLEQIRKEDLPNDDFPDNPLPVDAPPIERMRESLAGRKNLCIYDEEMQNELVVHFMCKYRFRAMKFSLEVN